MATYACPVCGEQAVAAEHIKACLDAATAVPLPPAVPAALPALLVNGYCSDPHPYIAGGKCQLVPGHSEMHQMATGPDSCLQWAVMARLTLNIRPRMAGQPGNDEF